MLVFTACDDALTVEPRDNRVTEAELFQDPATYRGIIAKAYAGLAVGGQSGGDGDADISGIDGGFSNYLRLYWNMQELTTDEAIIAWNDGTIKDLHGHVWTDGNEFINAMFSRVNYQIAVCNEFLALSTDAKLNEYNIPADIRADVAEYRAEARFLRAYSYYHGMDLFGKMPFRDVNYDPAVLPEVKNRAELFQFIELELLAIEDDMVAARMNEYGRADKAALWMLLSKIYLNAEVYTGTERNTDAITQLNKVISAGYTVPTVPSHFTFSLTKVFDRSTDHCMHGTWDMATTLLWTATTYGSSTSFLVRYQKGGYQSTHSTHSTRLTPSLVCLLYPSPSPRDS